MTPESDVPSRLIPTTEVVFMKVIVINGPMGVGKTATGKYIAEKIPGTAFIDGDWCMDIHPFVGNRETKTMAVDNILHMIGNYQRCSECSMVVLAWLMDDPWVQKSISEGFPLCGPKKKASRWYATGPAWSSAGIMTVIVNGEPINGLMPVLHHCHIFHRLKAPLIPANCPLTGSQT